MTQQTINTGTVANDGTGDTLRAGAIKINANFLELFGLIHTPYVINSTTGADNTGATEQSTVFTTMVRRACGLADDGTGTVGTVRPVFIYPGTYLLKAWNPTDSSGYALPVNLIAYPGTVNIVNKLSLSNTNSGAIDIDYSTYQAANKVQQLVTSITDGFAPATFGLSSAAANDDTVTILTVSDTTGFSAGDCAVICSQENLPHTNSSSSKSRVGESFRILNVDATNIYVQGRLSFHGFYETSVYVTRYDTRRTFRCSGITFTSAATTIGRTTATPSQLDHGLFGTNKWTINSLTQTSGTATAVTAVAHGLTTGQYVSVSGAINDTNQGNYNVTLPVTVVNSTTFTYTLPTKNDSNTTFSTIPASVSSPATGTPVYQDAFANLDSTALGSQVTIRNAVGSKIVNCDFVDPWTMSVRLYNSPEWLVNGCTLRGGPNHGTSANSFNSGRLGYGISSYGHSGDGVFSNSVAYNYRHVFTTDGKTVTTYTPTTDGSSSAWTALGVPTRCLVKNVNSFNGWGIPFDTHEEGSDIVFENCWAFNPQRGPGGGSYVGSGWQNRSRNTRIINCGQRGGGFGIRFAATEQWGILGSYSSSAGAVPLTYTVSSLTQTAGVATFVHGTGSNSVNTGAHLQVGDVIRIRGANESNYNVTAAVVSYDETTKTGTYTLPTKDDLGVTFGTVPASATTPATGTITLQVMHRTTHIVENFHCEGLRKGKSGALWLNAVNSLTYRHKVLVNGVTARNTQNVINAEASTICDATGIIASGIIYDSSSDQSGAVVGVQTTAIVNVGTMYLDVSDSVSNAPGIYPVRMSGTPTVNIGHLTLKQHPVYLACPRVFENKDVTSGKFCGLGKLTYINPGSLTTDFQIIKPGQEANMTWTGGGEELYIPTQTSAITNGTVTVGQRTLGNRFILRRAVTVLDANAVGTVTVDVKAANTTIFGTNKVIVSVGAASSDANTPTYSKTYFSDPLSLTVTIISTSGSETAKCNGVSLTGYWV
jgi:hypothetical protein